MKREQLEKANQLYQNISALELSNRELSRINTKTEVSTLIFDMPGKIVKVRIGKKTLKFFVEYLLAYGEQEIEKCKKEFEEL